MFGIRLLTFMQAIRYEPIRTTFFECHTVCSEYFRNSFRVVADQVAAEARRLGLTHIVELGAGTAPITELIAAGESCRGLRLSPCDAEPETHQERYRQLAERFGDQVTPVYEPVDYTQPRDWGPSALLILTGTFPAVPFERRAAAIQALSAGSERVMIWEFVRKTPLSMAFASCTFFTALLTPLFYFTRPGRLRRLLWCWLVPIVPVMCAVDGVSWCLHCWTDDQWRRESAEHAPTSRPATIRSWINSQLVEW